MQRIFNFDEWTTLVEGKKLVCGDEHSQPRTITLHVNAEDKVKLFVREQGTEHFLALVEGRDEVEFAVDGVCDVVVVGGYCNIRTAEQANWTMEAVDDTTFTTLVERRIRNPELELMMHVAQQNMEKRLAAQSAEFERRMEARLSAGNTGTATAPVRAATVSPEAAVNSGTGAADGSATGGTAEPDAGAVASSVASGSTPAPAGS